MGRTRLKTAPRLGVAALGGNTAISKKLRKGRKSATKLLYSTIRSFALALPLHDAQVALQRRVRLGAHGNHLQACSRLG